MKTIYTEKHKLRNSKTELYGGVLVPPFEKPERAEIIRARVEATGLGEIIAPTEHGLDPVRRIHDADFLDFLSTAYDDWQAAGFEGEVIAASYVARRMQARRPDFIDGKAGYHCLASETAICAGTWQAAQASADVALTGVDLVSTGEAVAFSLCRPPGHHATADMYGGYCFLNNAAIAAQSFLDRGAKRVAVLDVDFHHGNGTQDIFYARDDVFFASLHGRPEEAFPYFLGYADETGEGVGEGYTANYPFAPKTPYSDWATGLDAACDRIADYGAEALIVSLGVDTFEKDPISFFKLVSDDFRKIGARIAKLSKPTLFVMEGGYAVEEIGVNTVNTLIGFEGG
ncbi:MAG: histone deacetylase family protein [Pseudomonadota bacterium]